MSIETLGIIALLLWFAYECIGSTWQITNDAHMVPKPPAFITALGFISKIILVVVVCRVVF